MRKLIAVVGVTLSSVFGVQAIASELPIALAAPPAPNVVSVMANPHAVPSGHVSTQVNGAIRGALTCWMQQQSHPAGVLAIWSKNPRTCSGGRFSAKVVFFISPSFTQRTVLFSLKAKGGGKAVSTRYFKVFVLARAKPKPHPTTTTTSTTAAPPPTTTTSTTTTTLPPYYPPATSPSTTTSTTASTTTSSSTTSTTLPSLSIQRVGDWASTWGTVTPGSPPTLTSTAGSIAPYGTLTATASTSPSNGNTIAILTSNSVTMSFTTQAVGDSVMLVVDTHDPTNSVSSVSTTGTGAVTFPTSAAERFDPTSPSPGRDLEVWLGTVTQAGSTTITLEWASSLSSAGFVELDAQEFSSSYGSASTWTVDAHGSSQGTFLDPVIWPALAPTTAGPELYYGFVSSQGSTPSGSTPGFTYTGNADDNTETANPDVTSSQSPLGFTSGTWQTVGILVKVAHT